MDKLLAPEEFGAMVGWSKATVYSRYCRGEDMPPRLRIGRLVRIKRSDALAWLENRYVDAKK